MTIDWATLGIETVNIAVLVWLLGRFFWRPVSGIIEARRQESLRVIADARAQRQSASAELEESRRMRDGFGSERAKVLEAARSEAETLRAGILEEARKQAEDVRSRAEAELAARKSAQDAQWAEHSSRLAVDIAARLLGRVGSSATFGPFLETLADALDRLPADRRSAIAEGGGLVLVTAGDLAPAERTKVRERVAAALGSPGLDVTFETDPDLIAGIELHAPHLTVANSWKADLETIRREMAHAA